VAIKQQEAASQPPRKRACDLNECLACTSERKPSKTDSLRKGNRASKSLVERTLISILLTRVSFFHLHISSVARVCERRKTEIVAYVWSSFSHATNSSIGSEYLDIYKLQFTVTLNWGQYPETSCTTIVRCYLRVVPLRTCSHLFRYDSGNATERDIDI
jgi:hypothetical protein